MYIAAAAVSKSCVLSIYKEDIYFFEVNTKYISSNVLKISVISRMRSTSEFADIFNTLDEICLVNFIFIFFR